MSGSIELFYDDTPGEHRGVVVRNGQPAHILIQRENDPEAMRLGARSIGRVVAVEKGLSGAFVDLGCGLNHEFPSHGFLPFERDHVLTVGQSLEVVVTAEMREAKGCVLKRVGTTPGQSLAQSLAQGDDNRPRLLQAAPAILEQLATLAPDAEIITGPSAIQAGWEAVEEALSTRLRLGETGIDLAVERTRALIAVDIDFSPPPGRDARKGRAGANRDGLRQAARLIRLKRWGGLVVIDLVGTALDGPAVIAQAREAFGTDTGTSYGPVSRFGLMQLALPWRYTPLEEVLGRAGTERALQTEAIDLTRRLRHALLADTASPRLKAVCRPVLAERAGPLVAQLGPRAGLRPDATIRPGAEIIEEG